MDEGGCDISRVFDLANAVKELARNVAARETHLPLAASIVIVFRRSVYDCLKNTRSQRVRQLDIPITYENYNNRDGN